MRGLFVFIGLCLIFASPAKADPFLEIKEFVVYNVQLFDNVKEDYEYLSFDNWDKTEDNDGLYIKSGVGFASRLGAVDGHNAWLMLELKYDNDVSSKVSAQTLVRFYKDDNGIIEGGYHMEDGFLFRLKKSF